MNRLYWLFCILLFLSKNAEAVELSDLKEISPVISLTKTPNGVVLTCQDHSEVQFSVLAPDLVRVRASYKQSLPKRDRSWAIAKTMWKLPEWSVKETNSTIVISTDELKVVINRVPLLIEFRDIKTDQLINIDAKPMMFAPDGNYVAAAKKLGFDEHFYGLGEKAARLDKRRGAFTMWNSDTPGYIEGTDPIYQSIPFYMGWQQGNAYGIFFDNSYRSHFDFGRSSQQYITFAAEGGEMNYYFFWGPSMKKILTRYTELTGRIPLPPLWALGHQQSRWSYYPDTIVEELARAYRDKDLPLDVIHLDIHYMNGYRVFTWDPQHFPNPGDLINRLKQQGIKVVTIVDPGVKYQPPSGNKNVTSHPQLGSQNDSYYVYNEGLENNYFLKRKDGSLYIGKVWPGESVLVDYTLENARRWWGDLHKAYTSYGVAGIWTDMNEPSDFIDQTGRSQMDVVSYDEGEYSTHAKNRNVFALLMARATYEGLERLEPNKRPYIITRAGYAGIQRYSTMWTGDNNSTWEALALSIPMLQTLGLSGQAFVGTDVGGFIGRCNGELLTRWYQVSFLAPFCRNHKVIDGYDQEPWRFGEYYTDIIRKYLKLRYRLLPFLYTTLEEANRTGVPLFRPLILNYQQDVNVLNIDDQFMIGNDLLVAPILAANQTSRLVYLPAGNWFDYWTGKLYSGRTMIRVQAPLEVVPIFVRAGAIIPMWPEMNYIGEKPINELSFDIYPDDNGQANTTLYEDDGTSPAYQQGIYRRTAVKLSKSEQGFQIACDALTNNYNTEPRKLVFIVKSTPMVEQVLLDGKLLNSVKSGEKRVGWYQTADSITIQIDDDSKPHQIQIKQKKE
ncbi:MAG: TIM-barrel domain-containing protein [Acidobacteriota bacterium]